MPESICNVIPVQQGGQDLRIAHFVYETEYKTLHQPFFPLIYYLHIVTSGSGVLSVAGKEHPITTGDIFFGFPAREFTLKGSDDLRYIYISFMGADAQKMMEDMHIVPNFPVYRGHKDLCQTFYTTVKNSTQSNAMLLAQGLLFFTLSRLHPSEYREEQSNPQTFAAAVAYVGKHFTDPTLCLKTIAQVSSYTEKYISALFIKEMKMPFSKYLTYLRIERAKNLLTTGIYTIGQVAQLCGFTDPLYFSKVFKKETGCTPTVYKKGEHK